MSSALEWLSGVLFEADLNSTWQSASSSERAQILADAGLDQLSADEFSEAMLLLVDELPADQAIAISETVPAQAQSNFDGVSLLDHYVSTVEIPEQAQPLDEFDESANFDDFEPDTDPQQVDEIDLGEEFDIQPIEESDPVELFVEESISIDEFETTAIEVVTIAETEMPGLDMDETDFDNEFDLGE
jgi:hypothetical protein